MKRWAAILGALALLVTLAVSPALATSSHHHGASAPAVAGPAPRSSVALPADAWRGSAPIREHSCCPDHQCCLVGAGDAVDTYQPPESVPVASRPIAAAPVNPHLSRPRYLLPVWLAPPVALINR